MNTTDSSNPRRFAIGLSFPGEKREYVEQVAEALLPAFAGQYFLPYIFWGNLDYFNAFWECNAS